MDAFLRSTIVTITGRDLLIVLIGVIIGLFIMPLCRTAHREIQERRIKMAERKRLKAADGDASGRMQGESRP